MTDIAKSDADPDYAPLREAIALSEAARKRGNMPFGAVLVAPDGTVLARGENAILTDRDITSHAEINAIRAASKHCTPRQIAAATMYASGEPCPMCSGALIRTGVRRVVFGIRATVATPYLPGAAGAMVGSVDCRKVFAVAPTPVDIRGPLLEDEATVPFELFAGHDPARGATKARLHSNLRFAEARASVEKRNGGTMILRSPQALGPFPRALGEWLVEWAQKMPQRTFLAERAGDAWRRVSYAEALDATRRIGESLLARGLTAARPVAILSDNSVDHALLALGAMHAGIPVAPISPTLFPLK